VSLEQIESRLPSGFHDAVLNRLCIDFEAAAVYLDLAIDVGSPESATQAEREARRRARLTLTGLQYCVIDPPNEPASAPPGVQTRPPRGARIDIVYGQPSTSPRALPPLADGVSLYSIYVADWNSFIRLAAKHARLDWSDD
jgi:hypothetical protein